MALTLQQVIGQNPHLSQRMLVVQSVLTSLRADGAAVVGLDPAMEIPFSRAAVLWIFGAIVPRGVISQDGMMVVIQLFSKQLLEMAERWETQLESAQDELTPMVLAIADRKLVQLTGVPGCYDLQRCQQLIQTPMTFEGISYNLAIPVRLEWLRVQREIKHGDDAQNQRGTPGPYNPGNRAAGPGGRPAGPWGPPVGPDDGSHGTRGISRGSTSRRIFEQAYGKLRDSDE